MERRCMGCMKVTAPGSACQHCGFPESARNESHQLPIGTVLREQYVVGKVLGQGGFGITYLGWDQSLEEPVAIKEYFPNGQVSRNAYRSTVVECTAAQGQFQEGRDRFLKEARTLAKLRKAGNIVQVHGFFSENNTAYIIMEYVEGITLLQYMRQRGGRLSVSETFTVLRPVLRALNQVHQAGMIHRDISPDNIMLQNDGTVKLLDFGTARDVDRSGGQLTHSTQAVLKHGFAPMEQYSEGRAIDRRADEYALCATVWCCLTGRVPPDAPSLIMDGSRLDWKGIPGLTAQQTAALEKGTAFRADDRYPTLADLEGALFGPPEVPPMVDPEPAFVRKEQTPEAPAPQIVDIPGTLPMPEHPAQPVAIPETMPMPEVTPPAPPAVPTKKKRKWLIPAIAAIAAVVVLVIGCIDLIHAYQVRQDMAEQERQYQEEQERKYQEALASLESGNYTLAYRLFTELKDYKDSEDHAEEVKKKFIHIQTLSTHGHHTVAVKTDGTVVAVGSNRHDQCEVSAWTDIVSVVAGHTHTVGLRADGTVVAVGYNSDGQCAVSGWTDIIAVAVGNYHTVGLKSDGTVVARGTDTYDPCAVSGWSNIVAISASWNQTVGLRANGTVVAVGCNVDGQCNVSGWTDIIAISAGWGHTVGLRNDGTVVAVGDNEDGQCNVSDWTDIVAISAGPKHTVGLRADGTVVAVGWNEKGQCDVSDWTDIVAIAAGEQHTVGLKADGTVLVVGTNVSGQCDVSGWTDIRIPE